MNTVDDPLLAHRRTWDLIPWIVNGSASAAEREIADAHLRDCVDCRDELAFQSLLHAGMGIDAQPAHSATAGFARLMQRIDRDAGSEGTGTPATVAMPMPRTRAPARRSQRRRLSRILAGALALQSVGLVLLGALLLARPSVRMPPAATTAATYQTLSSSRASSASATVRFVPSPTLSVGALQAMLADAHLHIVDSNQDSAIYGLAPMTQDDAAAAIATPDERDAATARAIARLRATPGVLLAEPIAAPSVDQR